MQTATATLKADQSRQGLATPDELPALFAQFNLDYPEGLSFPFAHKWAPKEGRPLEQYQRRQAFTARLVIHPIAEYCDERGPIDAHAWQFIVDELN